MANRVPPSRDFNWGRTLRTLSFWALLIAGSIALVQFASSRRQDAADVSYSQFTEQLEAGNISTVEVTERQQLRGDFKSPVTIAHRTTEHFTTLLPFESSDVWVATLRQKGVDVRLPIAINSASKPETQDQTVLGIKADKTVWLNGVEVRREEMRTRLDAILETKKEKLILIKADEDAPYSAIMDAMDQLRASGIEDVGLITDSKASSALSQGGQ